MVPLIGNECSMRGQCSIPLNKAPSLNKLSNVPTAFSLAVSHSDPYTHDTLPTHPLPFPRTVRQMSPLSFARQCRCRENSGFLCMVPDNPWTFSGWQRSSSLTHQPYRPHRFSYCFACAMSYTTENP